MKYKALTVLACALLGAASAQAQLTIPLENYGSRGLRKVAVQVGRDTLDFLFDTGGGVTVISPEVAARIGCAPSGRSHGYRLTGEQIESPVCREVELQLSGYSTLAEASIIDLMKYLGPDAPKVHGMISLRTFQDQALTLDLQRQQLIVETEKSLRARVPKMHRVRARFATGLQGGELDVFIGVPAGPAELWLLWDSGHQGPTFISPMAAELLRVDSTQPERALPLGAAEAVVPVAIKRNMIHDGVLNARLVERATWSVDLARGQMWVSDVAPLLTPPALAANQTPPPPAEDPKGWYEVTLVVSGDRQKSLMQLTAAGARMRFLGDEQVITLSDVATDRNQLYFTLNMARAYAVRIEFDGVNGRGTWGDAARGGAVEAVKVR